MTIHPHPAVADVPFVLRAGTPDDAPTLNALINAHREEGHLLPREEDEIRARASRFVVADVDGVVKACAELVPLSNRLAEVRSLVVSGDLRRHGVATRLVDALQERAKAEGFQSLLALAHDPRFFIRHNFSIVPHEWLSEKIARDCRACALFRRCGQHAMMLPLSAGRQTGTAPMRLQHAAAVA
jgi:amino-acid N-acetyltransferase